MKTKEAIERVRNRFNNWALDNEDLAALQALGLVDADCEDERIRKWLINQLFAIKYTESAKEIDPIGYEMAVKALSWLEKRKEQKPVEYDHEMWKNCEANFEGGKKEVIDHPEKYGLCKPAEWSEEEVPDETKQECGSIDVIETLKNLLSYFQWERKSTREEINTSFIPCLEYLLKDAENTNGRAEWSEKKHKLLNYAISLTDDAEVKTFLESLRNQPKQEWSEEDETALGDLMWCIEQSRKCAKDENDMGNIWFAENWVKKRIKALRSQTYWEPAEKQKYDGNMDKECIKLCDVLNSIPSIDTFESCCGHLKDRYSIWFFCNDIIAISRLGRCVERNYSDGKWELLVDSTDTHPNGVFCLRSKVPFQSYDEMEKSVNELCNGIQYWFNAKFDSYF